MYAMDRKREAAFAEAHACLKKRKFDEVISLITNTRFRVRPVFREDMNHAWYLVGDALYRKGAYPKAAKAFLASHAADPEDEQAALAIGNCFFELGDLPMAERWTRCAYEMSGDAKAGYNLANIMYDQGFYRLSVALYGSLESKSPRVRRCIEINCALARKKIAARVRDD